MRLLRFLQRARRRKLFVIRRVIGDSMLPTLTPGTVVLGVRPFRVKVGDIVIIHHAGFDKIKRISRIRSDEIFVTGDNYLQSTDSRDFGWLKRSVIVAKVIWPNASHRK